MHLCEEEVNFKISQPRGDRWHIIQPSSSKFLSTGQVVRWVKPSGWRCFAGTGAHCTVVHWVVVWSLSQPFPMSSLCSLFRESKPHSASLDHTDTEFHICMSSCQTNISIYIFLLVCQTQHIPNQTRNYLEMSAFHTSVHGATSTLLHTPSPVNGRVLFHLPS